MNALVALGGIANECQLVAVLKHCNQTNESNHVLKPFYLKFSIYKTISILDEFVHVGKKGLTKFRKKHFFALLLLSSPRLLIVQLWRSNVGLGRVEGAWTKCLL